MSKIGMSRIIVATILVAAILLGAVYMVFHTTGIPAFASVPCPANCQEYTGKVGWIGHGIYTLGGYKYNGWYVKLGNATYVFGADSNLAMNVIVEAKDSKGKVFHITYFGGDSIGVYGNKQYASLYHVASFEEVR